MLVAGGFGVLLGIFVVGCILQGQYFGLVTQIVHQGALAFCEGTSAFGQLFVDFATRLLNLELLGLSCEILADVEVVVVVVLALLGGGLADPLCDLSQVILIVDYLANGLSLA